MHGALILLFFLRWVVPRTKLSTNFITQNYKHLNNYNFNKIKEINTQPNIKLTKFNMGILDYKINHWIFNMLAVCLHLTVCHCDLPKSKMKETILITMKKAAIRPLYFLESWCSGLVGAYIECSSIISIMINTIQPTYADTILNLQI